MLSETKIHLYEASAPAHSSKSTSQKLMPCSVTMVPPPKLTLEGTIDSTEATVCNNVALLFLIARAPEQLILRSAVIACT